MSDKVDKVCNKVITMQSDSTLHHEFTQSQIKKLSKDKEKLEKASKNTSLLASILSESMMILTTAMITNEIDKREQYNLPPEQGNQVAPSRFFSIIDGLVFDLADQQQQKLHPCKMTYRQLIIDKSELLKTSLVSVVNAWDTIANQGVEDLIESSPGKIFKNQIQNKIKIENKKPTRPSSLGRSKPYAAENESQNWARYASSEIRTHSNSLSLGSNNASSNNPLPLKNITTINNQANPNSSLIGLSNTLNYLSLNQNSNNNNSNNNNNNNNNNSSSNNNNHISSNNYTNNSNIIGYQIPTDNNDSSDLIFNKLITNHSAQLADIDNIDGKKQLNKKKQNNSQKLSLSHRKILKTTQQFNQAHLISLSKTLTKPNTSTERQREKIQKNASEAHRVDITFCN